MAFVQPRRWRTLDRHSLGAEYPDLSPVARERMVEGLRKHGVLNKRKVVLHEGKVLDGWQLYQGCLEADVKPEFAPLPKGISAEEFVEIVNDTRRHETQETAIARAVARREKVRQLAEEGASLGAIAEETGVSKTQVKRDLEASGVPGGTPETNGHENGAVPEKVRGKDGKSYPKQDVLKPPYNLIHFNGPFNALVGQVRKLAEAYGAEDTPPVAGLNRLLGEFSKQFTKVHLQLKKKHKE